MRVRVFALPEVPADRPTTVRVHLCPELPDQIDEMLLCEVCGLLLGGVTPLSSSRWVVYHLCSASSQWCDPPSHTPLRLTVVCHLPLQESEWGACVEAGSSEVLELYQGAKLELSVQVVTPLPSHHPPFARFGLATRHVPLLAIPLAFPATCF